MKDLSNEIAKKLLAEAIEALDYGLKFYKESEKEPQLIKQSIINMQRFVEYILKYFIAKIHPLLIFQKPFDRYIESIKSGELVSISFDQALTFYINILELKLVSAPLTYEKKKFIYLLKRLKYLRNNVVHYFLHNEINSSKELSEVVELMYYVCLEHNIESNIRKNLSEKSLAVLETLIDTQKARLKAANKKIKENIENYYATNTPDGNTTSFDTREILFDCEKCQHHTFILIKEENLFECKYCGYKEKPGYCGTHKECSGGPIPKRFLQEFQEFFDGGFTVCEACLDYFFAEQQDKMEINEFVFEEN